MVGRRNDRLPTHGLGCLGEFLEMLGLSVLCLD